MLAQGLRLNDISGYNTGGQAVEKADSYLVLSSEGLQRRRKKYREGTIDPGDDNETPNISMMCH